MVKTAFGVDVAKVSFLLSSPAGQPLSGKERVWYHSYSRVVFHMQDFLECLVDDNPRTLAPCTLVGCPNCK